MSCSLTSSLSAWTPSPIKSLAARYGADGLACLGFLGVQNMLAQTIYDDIESEEYSVSKTAVAAVSMIILSGMFIKAGLARFKCIRRADQARQQILPILESNVPKGEDKRDVVLWIRTTADHNDAFDPKSEQDKFKLISKYFKVEYLEVYALYQITEKMQSLQPRKIKHLIISAHGERNFVHLSGHTIPCCLTKDWITQEHFPNLADGAHILISACNAGLPDGLAERFSSIFPNAFVYANTSSSYATKSWFFLDKDQNPGMICFSPASTEVITRLFHNREKTDYFAPTVAKKYFSDEIIIGSSITSEQGFEDSLYASAELSDSSISGSVKRTERLHESRMNRMQEGPRKTFSEIEQSMLNANPQTIQAADWNEAVCDLIALLHKESQKEVFTACLAEDGEMERQKKLFAAIHQSNPKYETSPLLEQLEESVNSLESMQNSLTPEQLNAIYTEFAISIYLWYVTWGASNPEKFERNTQAVERLINDIQTSREKMS